MQTKRNSLSTLALRTYRPQEGQSREWNQPAGVYLTDRRVNNLKCVNDFYLLVRCYKRTDLTSKLLHVKMSVFMKTRDFISVS